MAVSLRLKMLGTKHRPVYRVVALDSRKTRDGRTLENLGRYAPLNQPATVELKEDLIMEYLKNGAKPSETVKNLLRQNGIVKEWQKNESGASKLVWIRRN